MRRPDRDELRAEIRGLLDTPARVAGVKSEIVATIQERHGESAALGPLGFTERAGSCLHEPRDTSNLAQNLRPCGNFLSGRSRTRTWDLFLIREAL